MPIIHYSVIWWNTLHQGPSISIVRRHATIDGSMLWPLLVSALGFSLLFGAIVLMRMRAELARNKVEARHAADGGSMNPWPFVIAAYAHRASSRRWRWPS